MKNTNEENRQKTTSANKFTDKWRSFLYRCGSYLCKLGEEPVVEYKSVSGNFDTGLIPNGDRSNGIHAVESVEPFGENEEVDDVSSVKVTDAVSGEKVLKKTVELIEAYDRDIASVNDEMAKNLYTDIATRLVDSLIAAGCEPICPQAGEPFDIIQHTTIPFSMPDSSIIKQTLRMGVRLNGVVYVKAIVQLEEEQDEIL